MRNRLCLPAIAIFAGVTGTAFGQSWQPPSEAQRCPSKWGAADERGSGNHMKPESVLRATRLIRTGEVIELGRVLSPTIPVFGTRRFDMHLKRTFMNPQPNRRGSNEELVVSEIGQVGTQLDGFTHQTIGPSVYNCFPVDEIATRTGFTKAGIDKVGMLMTRGVLIDVAALKGVPMLSEVYEITARDLQDAGAAKMTLEPGDAVSCTRAGAVVGSGQRLRQSAPASAWARPGLAKQVRCSSERTTGPWSRPESRCAVESASSPDHAGGERPSFAREHELDELAAKRIYEFRFVVQPEDSGRHGFGSRAGRDPLIADYWRALLRRFAGRGGASSRAEEVLDRVGGHHGAGR